MSIDLKPMSEALEYLPSWLNGTLNYFWAKGYDKRPTSIKFFCYSKPACIAGGFASFCQGEFCNDDISVLISSRLTDNHCKQHITFL